MSEFVFGTLNAAFVQVMYEQYLRDPQSVGAEWRELFDNGRLAELPVIPTTPAEAGAGQPQRAVALAEPAAPAAPSRPAPAPPAPAATATTRLPSPVVTPLIGPAARLVQNMADSLTVPTATSFRDITVDVLDARRKFLNGALAPRGLKVSYTHLIGYAIVQAARSFTMMTHAFRDVDGKPYRVDPQGVHLGIAVDVQKKDGSHALVVPVIKRADGMDFAGFHTAYEALIHKSRASRLVPDDFSGGTITLTNPGTLGTIASVPRLMKGQGSIIATGAIRQIGPAKVLTITSTYDHRVIQGAESGMFLGRLEALLQGEDGFYEGIFASLGLTGRGTRDGGVVSTPGITRPPSPLPVPSPVPLLWRT